MLSKMQTQMKNDESNSYSNNYATRIRQAKMSKDEQEICVKTGKSKTYNLVHPKHLAANIYF